MEAHVTTQLDAASLSHDEDGPLPGETFAECWARQSTAAQAEIDRQMAFLETADFADIPLVLTAVLDLLDDGDDPRLVAGIKTLARLLGRPARQIDAIAT